MDADKRIESLVSHFNSNIKAFAELCGYDRPQAFYDVLKGRTRNISPTMCDRILAAFPSVNRVWLLTGEGEMIKPEKGRDETIAARLVPFVSMSALAGPIKAYYEDGVDLANCPRVVDISMSAELAIPICGDSMEPRIPNGATAFISSINDAAFIPWDHPLVIETENGIFVKIVRPDENDDAYIWAESINPKYRPIHMPKSSIIRLFRIHTLSIPFV